MNRTSRRSRPGTWLAAGAVVATLAVGALAGAGGGDRAERPAV